MTRTVLCTVGTRPEAIKMAPLIAALNAAPEFRCRVLATAQHRQMLDQALGLFGIVPDIDLDIMQPDQTLTALTGRLLLQLGDVLSAEKPDIILAQGDTTTVMATAMAAFYAGIDFGHVEAGLRTGSIRDPFPEEFNRVLTARIARWHFAPTETAGRRLLEEGCDAATVHVTGNTVIDALRSVASRVRPLGIASDHDGPLCLVTLHRRENFGAPLLRICAALKALLDDNPDLRVLVPVHPNPNVAQVVLREFGGHNRVTLSAPLDYADFIAAMKRSTLILTDSGGVQEEAPALGKPVLVLRETTERPEAVAIGAAALVGTATEDIRVAAQRLLTDREAYAAMAQAGSPYGDGHAADRIVSALRGVTTQCPTAPSQIRSVQF